MNIAGYETEGRLLAKLSHPRIVRVTDFVIRNDGSVEDLCAGVRAFAETIREFNTRGEKKMV